MTLLSTPRTERGQAIKALILVTIGSLCIQLSSAISVSLFEWFPAFTVSSLRMTLAAVFLLVLLRPKLSGRSTSNWVGICVYGTSMAAMNMSFTAALERLPLGVAVTLEFLGPCAVALLASRHLKEGLCAVAALLGVVLISGPGGYFDLVGYLFGLSAALFFGLYTLFSERVGKADEDMSGLALAVTAAAVVSFPFAVGHLGEPNATQWGLLALSAFLGVVVTFLADTIAARVSSARVVGTLFSVDPAIGSIVGFVVLGQAITPVAIGGILIVASAGALLVWISNGEHPPLASSDHPEAEPATSPPAPPKTTNTR